MSNFFNVDNAFFTAINKFVDLIVISLVWLICCIPIFTIGPATASLYYAVVKVIRRDRGYLVREFFRSFKMNFKVGTISGILLTLLYFILFFDRKFAAALEDNQRVIMLSIFNVMLLMLFCTTLYIFPVLSRFSVGVKQLFKTSFFIAIRHLPTTILMAIITIALMLGTYIMPIALIISPALCTLLISLLLERVLKKYMPPKSEDAEHSGRDEWYLE
ncbi:MAG: DUF624 domain-containing protein [Lachnoclostridium sp.]